MRQKFNNGFTPVKSATPTARKRYLTGFTLIELLVVCAIIAVLATVVIVNLTGAKENSKVTSAVSLLNTVRKASELYKVDTKKWPATCRSGGTNPISSLCTTSSITPAVSGGAGGIDTFFWDGESRSGWNGPYFENGISTITHPWGGSVNYFNAFGGVCSGTGQGIVLDDDRPLQLDNDNQGTITGSALLKIDKIMDDGFTGSGSMTEVMDTQIPPQPIGELVYCYPSS